MEDKKPKRRELQDEIVQKLLDYGKRNKDDVLKYVTRLRTDELSRLNELLNIDPNREGHPGVKRICEKPINEILDEWKQYITNNSVNETNEQENINSETLETKTEKELVEILNNSFKILRENNIKTMKLNFMIGKTLQFLFLKLNKTQSWDEWLAINIPHYSKVHIDYFRRIWRRHGDFIKFYEIPVPLNTFIRLSKKIDSFLQDNPREASFWKGENISYEDQEILIQHNRGNVVTLNQENIDAPNTNNLKEKGKDNTHTLTKEEIDELEELIKIYQEGLKKRREYRRNKEGKNKKINDDDLYKPRKNGLDLRKTQQEKLLWLRKRLGKPAKDKKAIKKSRKISRKSREKISRKIRHLRKENTKYKTLRTFDLPKVDDVPYSMEDEESSQIFRSSSGNTSNIDVHVSIEDESETTDGEMHFDNTSVEF